MSGKFWLTGVCISLVLALGLGIRLTGLERKYFWLDELSSSFVITGHWPPFVEQELSRYSGQMIRVGVALGVLEQMPNRAPLRLVGALAANDPLHCPLYYLLAQEWSKHFAAGPRNLRLLASLMGAAGLLLFFWLCVEVFGTLSSGVLGMALLGVAPLHIIYSQQNREYGLLFALSAAATALLLCAGKTRAKGAWVLYALTALAGLYTSFLFVPLLAAHFVFQCRNDRRQFRDFLWAAGVAVLCFAPWAFNLLLRLGQIEGGNEWSTVPVSPRVYVEGLLLGFSRLFMDFNLPLYQPIPWERISVALPMLVVVAVVGVSASVALRRLETSLRTLLLAMLAFAFLVPVAADWLGSGRHAITPRYLLPAWIAIYIAVAGGVDGLLRSKRLLRREFGVAALLVLLGSGVSFAREYLPSAQWWTVRPLEFQERHDAMVASGAELLITSPPIWTKDFLMFCYTLPRELPLFITSESAAPPEFRRFSVIALFNPSETVKQAVTKNFELALAADHLWIGTRTSSGE